MGKFEDISILETPAYFYGIELNQEINVELEPGKTLVITLDALGDPDDEGCVPVYFSLNGHPRQVEVRDRSRASKTQGSRKAERDNPKHVGASMPGTVIGVHVKAGDKVAAGAPLITLEAMKMEMVVRSPRAASVQEVVPSLKSSVQAGDLLALLA